MNSSLKLRGSLLLEVMVACALLAIILPLVGSAMWRLQERHRLVSTYLSRQHFHSALKSQFLAHWSRLRPVGCSIEDALYLTIGQSQKAPSRLARRDLVSHSDWLEATDYGDCRLSVGPLVSLLDTETASTCDVAAGDWMNIATCSGSVEGQVTQSSQHHIRLRLSSLNVFQKGDKESISLEGLSGIAQTQMPFYWYVSAGKSGDLALWRTPKSRGNSLELWTGLQRMAVFPLLDNNHDGLVDTIDKHYGKYALRNTLGLWIEYLYKLPNCNMPDNTQIQQGYRSMRGDIWHYSAPCQGVGNQIIVFNR